MSTLNLHSIRQTWSYSAGTVHRQADVDRMNLLSRAEADAELVRLGRTPDPRDTTDQKWAEVDSVRGGGETEGVTR